MKIPMILERQSFDFLKIEVDRHVSVSNQGDLDCHGLVPLLNSEERSGLAADAHGHVSGRKDRKALSSTRQTGRGLRKLIEVLQELVHEVVAISKAEGPI